LGNVDLVARLIYAEARGESMNGKKAVAQLVINRQLKNSSEFGGTSVHGVVLKSPGGFVGMTTSAARCPSTSTQQWQDSLSAANNPGSGLIGKSLWFNTNTVFNNQSRTSNGYLEYKFPGTSTYKRVVERYVIGNHTFFRVSGY
jgi:spore germination cell wall hydrolase CwlJ-like protein